MRATGTAMLPCSAAPVLWPEGSVKAGMQATMDVARVAPHGAHASGSAAAAAAAASALP